MQTTAHTPELSSPQAGRPPPPLRLVDMKWGRGGLGPSVIGGVSLLVFLTVNAGIGIYRSQGDAGAIASVASAYLNIVSLIACVALFLQAPRNPSSPRRSRLKAALCLLTTALTFQYVYETTGPTAAPTLTGALLLWAMPAATGIAVFYVFFQEDRFNPQQQKEEMATV